MTSAGAREPGSELQGTILVVDDTDATLRLLERLLAADGHRVLTASNGDEAVALARAGGPDVVLMDVRMPVRDGFAACRALKHDAATQLIPVVLMTGSAEPEDRIRAIESGADDFLTKPVDRAELRARVRSLLRLKRHTDELDSAGAMLLSLALTIEARDPYTVDHCHRLAAYACALGADLGLGDEDLKALYRGGYLHDLGKIAVPDAILLKAGPLTPEEFAVIREHPVVGDRLCGPLRVLRRVRPIVRHHHERLDGSGYPDGLRGDEIPLLAQIVSLVDAFDAITSERPYQRGLPSEAALAELEADVARGWRRGDMVAAFGRLARSGALDDALRTTPRVMGAAGAWS
ncbi:MAG: response regulator [Vicinamibacterales bacterium]